MMKRDQLLALIALLALTVALVVGCTDAGRGMEGNIYQKMTIFSLLALTAVGALFVPLLGNSRESTAPESFRDLVGKASPRPIRADELTGNPVYVWDSPKSFYKLRFAEDGSLAESPIVTTNALDPDTRRCGTWAITGEGKLELSREASSRAQLFTKVSPNRHHLPALLRRHAGFAEAWFMGANGLADLQISCFGYPGSRPSSRRFRSPLVSGLTVYWGTYPCLVPASEDELCVNALLAYGVMTFHADGTLSKSISNPIGPPADYRQVFTGSWRVDENFGVLKLSTGSYTTEITLLHQDAGGSSLLVGSPAGSEQWFLDPEHAKDDLLDYLALGVRLDAGQGARSG